MKKGKGVQEYDCPKCGDPCMSPTGHVNCAIERDDEGAEDATKQGKILHKVRRLLALAEGTKFEEEAASAWAKAQELMQEYAIDEALARQQETGTQEKIVTHIIPFVKRQARRARKRELLRVVAGANRVRAIDSDWELAPAQSAEFHKISRWLRDDKFDTPQQREDALKRYQELKKESGIVYLVGLESDVSFTELLYMSCQMQAYRFMSQAFVEHGITREKNGWGSAFLAGFNSRVAARLSEQNQAAVKKYEHKTVTAADGAIVPVNVALALREVSLLVNKAVDEQFGDGLKRGRGAKGGNDPVGRAAGRAAGDRADLSGGRNRIGSGQKRLTS